MSVDRMRREAAYKLQQDGWTWTDKDGWTKAGTAHEAVQAHIIARANAPSPYPPRPAPAPAPAPAPPHNNVGLYLIEAINSLVNAQGAGGCPVFGVERIVLSGRQGDYTSFKNLVAQHFGAAVPVAPTGGPYRLFTLRGCEFETAL